MTYSLCELFILRFSSNNFASGMGFQLKYESSYVYQGMTIRFNECGGYFSTPNGTITSPFYPENYPGNQECFYTISQPSGTAIMLNFLSLNIHDRPWIPNYNCDHDYLEIRDGPSNDSPLLDKLCGTEIPAPIQSNQNKMWMK